MEGLSTMFFEQGRPHPVVVGGTLLREKHLCVVIEELKASNGWITCFKQRHGVVYETVFGEYRSVDSSMVEVQRKNSCSKLCMVMNLGTFELKIKKWQRQTATQITDSSGNKVN